MAHQGATLQTYNNELVSCLEELKEKRDIVARQMAKEERVKADVMKKIHHLQEELAAVNASLSDKQRTRDEYDNTIRETEAAYMKILESSQTLLQVLKRESSNLGKHTHTSSSSSPMRARPMRGGTAATTTTTSGYTLDFKS